MEIMFLSNNRRLPSHVLRIKPLKAILFVFSKNTAKNKWCFCQLEYNLESHYDIGDGLVDLPVTHICRQLIVNILHLFSNVLKAAVFLIYSYYQSF